MRRTTTDSYMLTPPIQVRREEATRLQQQAPRPVSPACRGEGEVDIPETHALDTDRGR